MKPAFALSFSATGISLHHQSEGDWFAVGSVALDAPELADDMQALRDKGFALANDLNCKLIIPQDQVRFLTVDTGGLTAEDAARKVREALSTATPYDLSELCYDTATEGSKTQVAAVACQTLDEARDFAIEHGFVPVLFSADAAEGSFPREPEFSKVEATAPVVASAPAVEDPKDTPPPEPEVSKTVTALPPKPEVAGPSIHAITDTPPPGAFRLPPPEPAVTAAPRPRIRPAAVFAGAAVLLLGVSVAAWNVLAPDDRPETAEVAPELPAPDTEVVAPPETAVPASDTQIAAVPLTETPEAEAPASLPEAADEPGAETQPELSATDAAILEALKVQPTPVEDVAKDPEALENIEEFVGIDITPPLAPIEPASEPEDEFYQASLDRSDLSSDAIALPPLASFETDTPIDLTALPSVAGTRYELDERGLVTPTPDGTLNPDGVIVYLGRPAKVPPDVPVRFEEEPLIQEADQRLAGFRPRLRPGNLVEQFERTQLGGRSLQELAVLRPKLRPKSLQARPQVDETPTALAVVRVPRPKNRPARLVAANANRSNLGSTAAVNQSGDEAGSFKPKTVAPKIPSAASVARQATIDNAINLRKLNLIGVYGTPANRRALVRLPSGRYKKLKVGDRIDGGKIIAISDSELRYQKKGRNLKLTIPSG